MMGNDLTVVILNYNGTDDTIDCIKSIDEQITNYTVQIVVLDNNSSHEQYQKLEEYCQERKDFSIYNLDVLDTSTQSKYLLVRSPDNYGFARGNNEIAKRFLEKSKYILFLNNDTELEKSFFQDMLDFLKMNPTVKYASCRINYFYDKDMLWSCGGTLSFWGNRHGFTERELELKGLIVETPYITGCALFLETEMLKTHGLLSEDFFFGEEDFNFCWRMKAENVRGACLNKTLVYHKVSQSSQRSGVSIGKTAGYYTNRIIDMHKFYNQFTWHVWKELLKLFVRYSCRKKGMSKNDVKEVIDTINKYENNTRLTREDCLAMRRF